MAWDIRDIELAGLRAEIKALKRDLEETAQLRQQVAAARNAYATVKHDFITLQSSVSRLLHENLELQKQIGGDAKWITKQTRKRSTAAS